jgi:GNAT superfamily N-acetyltransferase
MQVALRTIKPQDLNFIFDSWMKSWRTSKYAGVTPNHMYYDVQRTLIEGLIARGATLLVAHPLGRDDVILGWACGEEKDGASVLHYLYVKDPFLGHGISEQLLEGLPGTKPGFITHRLNSKEWKEWRHVPEMARRKQL